MWRPSSFNRPSVFGPNAPMDFRAAGENICPAGRPWHFSLPRVYAAAATIPGFWVAKALYDSAKVSTHVVSQTINRPDVQGTSVTPSGLLPSDLKRPIGSNLEGTLAAVQLHLMRSFTAACRWCLPRSIYS